MKNRSTLHHRLDVGRRRVAKRGMILLATCTDGFLRRNKWTNNVTISRNACLRFCVPVNTRKPVTSIDHGFNFHKRDTTAALLTCARQRLVSHHSSCWCTRNRRRRLQRRQNRHPESTKQTRLQHRRRHTRHHESQAGLTAKGCRSPKWQLSRSTIGNRPCYVGRCLSDRTFVLGSPFASSASNSRRRYARRCRRSAATVLLNEASGGPRHQN